MLVLGLFVGLLVLLALVLVYGVRAEWLDERRRRLLVVGIAVVVLLGGLLGLQAWARYEVRHDADGVAERLRTALDGSGPEQLPSELELLTVGISGIDIVAVDTRANRTVVYSPVSSLGQDRCVRGEVRTSGTATVSILDETCPSS